MAYPGLTLAIMVGVALGTAIYYYFNQENPNQQRQNSYQYERNYDDYISSSNSWDDPNDSTRRRKRRNSVNSSTSKCSICLDDISKGAMKTIISECGHEFHEHCIAVWFRQSRICPNCRAPVSS